MAPYWVTILADVSLAVAGVCFFVIIIDILAGHPQKMMIMNFVWPITALYFGVIGLWAYYAIGRKATKDSQMEPGSQPYPVITYKGATHCGAGCTLGDIGAEWAVFLAGWTIAGIELWPRLIGDYALAWLFGIVFQYFTIAPMRNLPVLPGIWAAIKADTLSITAFEVGLFGWMTLSYFVLFSPPLKANQPAFWFMMQVGMILGFFTSYPVNWWLIRVGLKEKM